MNKSIIQYQIENDRVSQVIKNGLGDLKRVSIQQARELGSKNLPSVGDTDLLLYAGGIKTGGEELLAEISTILFPDAARNEGRAEIERAKKQLAKLHGQLRDAQDEEEEHRKLCNNCKNAKLNTPGLIVGIFFAMMLFLGDTSFNTFTFRAYGDGIVSALLISISISAVLHCTALGLLPGINWITKSQKLRRILVVIAAICIFILGLHAGNPKKAGRKRHAGDCFSFYHIRFMGSHTLKCKIASPK